VTGSEAIEIEIAIGIGIEIGLLPRVHGSER